MDLQETARRYLDSGLCVLPADAAAKRPDVPSWKGYQARLPQKTEIDRWFGKAKAICLVCGGVSGNLEMLDFDLGGEAFEAWHQAVEAADPKLLARLVIEQSPSGGWHVVYRCQSVVSGNMKLAQRRHAADGPDEVTIAGKRYKPRKDAEGNWSVLLTLIETRGQGGQFLCAPTPKYELLQGEFSELPVITGAERELLLQAAWALNRCLPEPVAPPMTSSVPAEGRPGDDFNERGDVRDLLRRHGWELAKTVAENEYWRRPGKASGWSATLKGNVFYVFSHSAEPFEGDRGYMPFSVFALLEHGGDFATAASALRSEGFGRETAESADVDLSKILPAASHDTDADEAREDLEEVKPIPESLMQVPGFVSDVMDFSMYAARYPSLPMAFCAAMALQSFLCSRKVREEGGLRPNLYMLALADSGVGKAFPRKVNSHILNQIGMGGAIGNQISSGQGLEDEIVKRRKMIYQTDEVDHLVRSIAAPKESYHSMLLNMLLMLYSEADQIHTARTKARNHGRNEEQIHEVDQPGLVILGTATPECFYESLSTRLLTNGLFSRSIIVDVEDRGKRQRTHDVSEMPPHLLETARWWKEYNLAPANPLTGQKPNLDDEHPTPAVVPQSEDGYAVLEKLADLADEEYSAAKRVGDRIKTILWTRAHENAMRLALVYACSRDHQNPCIDGEVATWASSFVKHLVRRMLFMAMQHVAENPFHAECLKLIRKLRACGGQMARRELMRCLHAKAADFDQIVNTLLQQGDVVPVDIPGKSKTALGYKLA